MLGNGTSKFQIKTRINAIGNYQLETHGNGSYYEISWISSGNQMSTNAAHDHDI